MRSNTIAVLLLMISILITKNLFGVVCLIIIVSIDAVLELLDS